jgi:hypothetical protein
MGWHHDNTKSMSVIKQSA